MSGRDLRKAIARIAQIHEKQIPLSDVAELVKKYDPNHDGLDYDELKTMLTALVSRRDLRQLLDLVALMCAAPCSLADADAGVRPQVRVHVRFTGHEVLDQLSLPQLRSLRMHDWSLPVPDYREVLALSFLQLPSFSHPPFLFFFFRPPFRVLFAYRILLLPPGRRRGRGEGRQPGDGGRGRGRVEAERV